MIHIPEIQKYLNDNHIDYDLIDRIRSYKTLSEMVIFLNGTGLTEPNRFYSAKIVIRPSSYLRYWDCEITIGENTRRRQCWEYILTPQDIVDVIKYIKTTGIKSLLELNFRRKEDNGNL